MEQHQHHNSNSKKRKLDSSAPKSTSLPSSTTIMSDKTTLRAAAEINVEKLMKKLKDMEAAEARQQTGKQSGKATSDANMKPKKQKSDTTSNGFAKPAQRVDSSTQPLSSSTSSRLDKTSTDTAKTTEKPHANKEKRTSDVASANTSKVNGHSAGYVPTEADLAKREARKRKRSEKGSEEQPAKAAKINATTSRTAPPQTASDTAKPSAMTSLQKNMQKKLGGARFRWINEQLYTSSGQAAHELIQGDPSIFDEYHSGFRSQASGWPVQPIDVFIRSFKSAYIDSAIKPVIADLGCGDAQLARSLVPLGFTVLSYDLISVNAWVVEAQCTQRVPLPGSNEKGKEGQAAIVDVVVCCLSLMGMDWLGMIRESRRILKEGGLLRIAEVASRFTNRNSFIAMIEDMGFKLSSKDESNTHFITFDFEAAEVNEDVDLEEMRKHSNNLLKPCLYKKR